MSAGKGKESVSVFAVVDEIEEDLLVLVFDDNRKLTWPRKEAPAGTREGTVLRITLERDEEERKRREDKIRSLQQRLLERTRKGHGK